MMKKLLAATGCMIVVACAGGKKMASSPEAVQPGSAAPSTEPMGVDRKTELDKLYAEIEAQRGELKLPEPQVPMCEGDACGRPTPQALTPHPTTTRDTTCKPSKSDTCTSSCTLSDSICTNADRICELADELKPDNDAAAKCEKATATCKTAHEKCCSCL